MFSSLASYIWGSAEEESPVAADAPSTKPASDTHTRPCRTPSPSGTLKTRPAENEWVLVENTSCEGSPCRLAGPAAPGVSALRGSPSGDEDWDPSMDCGSCDPVTPNPTVASACPPRRASPPDVMQSSQSDTCSDVSTLPDIPGNEESWLVTPPPCFTAGPRSPLSALETSSMENLLIEHPSMSVYASRGRQNSEGVDSTHSDSDEETSNVVVPAVAARGHTIRQPPRRPHAVAERAGLTTSQKVALQQYKTRSMTRSSLKRQNLVCQRVSRNKAAARRGRVVQPCPRGQRHC